MDRIQGPSRVAAGGGCFRWRNSPARSRTRPHQGAAMRPKPHFLATIVLSAVGLQAQEAGRPPQERRPPATRVISRADVDVRRRALAALLHEQWEHHLRSHPEFASIIGDKRYNDKLSDFSQAAVDRNLEQAAAFLRRFE